MDNSHIINILQKAFYSKRDKGDKNVTINSSSCHA